jgi:uncharacterized protein (TIGR00730 family)
MSALRSVCVYCGSQKGASPAFTQAAADLGAALAREGLTLVYGGASVGLMGVVADAALAAGGRVIGVIPRILMRKELAHAGVTELVVTESMHERKAQMAARSDAFIALPGSIGTLDELFWGARNRKVSCVPRPGHCCESFANYPRLVPS